MTGDDLKRAKARERKKRQRDRLTAWCKAKYGVCDPESVVRILIKEEKRKAKK